MQDPPMHIEPDAAAEHKVVEYELDPTATVVAEEIAQELITIVTPTVAGMLLVYLMRTRTAMLIITHIR